MLLQGPWNVCKLALPRLHGLQTFAGMSAATTMAL